MEISEEREIGRVYITSKDGDSARGNSQNRGCSIYIFVSRRFSNSNSFVSAEPLG